MKQGKTLEQLGAELQRQRTARADFIADTRQLYFKTDNNKSRITFESGGKTMDFGINPLAHQQIASRLGIPLKYYQRMQAKRLWVDPDYKVRKGERDKAGYFPGVPV